MIIDYFRWFYLLKFGNRIFLFNFKFKRFGGILWENLNETENISASNCLNNNNNNSMICNEEQTNLFNVHAEIYHMLNKQYLIPNIYSFCALDSLQ